MVDYIAKLGKLFNQLAGAGEKQGEKDKLYALRSNLPIQYHPFRTAIANSPNYDDIKYDDVCDRLILEHQQLIGDTGKALGCRQQPVPMGHSFRREGHLEGDGEGENVLDHPISLEPERDSITVSTRVRKAARDTYLVG